MWQQNWLSASAAKAHLAKRLCLWLATLGLVIQLLIIASSSVRKLQAVPDAK